MNTNEVFETIATMNRTDFSKLLTIIEGKKDVFLKEDAIEMQKKIALGKFASYKRNKTETVWGEVVSMNKQYVFIETVKNGNKHRRAVEYNEVLGIADSMPVSTEPTIVPDNTPKAAQKPTVAAKKQ